MKFSIPVRELKKMGYTFQKLYANNYITYKKKISSSYTIWLWSFGKTIEINDYHGYTDNIISFFKAHIDDDPVKDYITIEYNAETAEIRLVDPDNYWKQIQIPDNPYFETWHKTTIFKPTFNEVLKEIEKLNPTYDHVIS